MLISATPVLWDKVVISRNSGFTSTCKSLENLINFNLEQMVKISTRDRNILDLFLTNQPGKVHATKTLPSLGSSDHDIVIIVFHEISVPIGQPIQPKRNIKLHGKANWEKFKADINSFNESLQSQDESDPNNLWTIFKTEIDRLSNIHIPSKVTRSRSDLPWITRSIRKKGPQLEIPRRTGAMVPRTKSQKH